MTLGITRVSDGGCWTVWVRCCELLIRRRAFSTAESSTSSGQLSVELDALAIRRRLILRWSPVGGVGRTNETKAALKLALINLSGLTSPEQHWPRPKSHCGYLSHSIICSAAALRHGEQAHDLLHWGTIQSHTAKLLVQRTLPNTNG